MLIFHNTVLRSSKYDDDDDDGCGTEKRLSGSVITGNVQNTQDPNPTKTRAPTNIIYIARPGLESHPCPVANRSPSPAHHY